ncbi:permease, partial [Streptococcus suis]
EADAFIGASLQSSIGFAPVMAFVVIGPRVDVKNLLMMKHYFKGKFIVGFINTITLVILGNSLILGGVV